MKKGILIVVGAVFAFVIIRMLIIVVVLLSTPHGEVHKQGLITGQEGDWEAAITYFDKVIEMRPYHEKAYASRAFAKTKLGDYQGAIDDCNTAIGKYPFDGRTYAVLGIAEYQSGQKKKGCEDMSTAFDLGFEQAKDYLNLYCK